MLVVVFSHALSHADSFIFPACQTRASSVPLQEQELNYLTYKLFKILRELDITYV